jgi:hypothetical protein
LVRPQGSQLSCDDASARRYRSREKATGDSHDLR